MASHGIIGHTYALETLTQDLETGNVAHGYLFAGPRHVGKFTVAQWFARELLTVDAGGDEERARRLHAFDRLLHPDFFVLDQLWIEDQQEDMNALSKSTNLPQQHRAKAHARTDTISIDDIRVLQERLHEVGGSRFRCCLIRSVERMQDAAVNALLKVLEEPPPGVVFLLTTQAMSSLLPTLVSRTRVVQFSPVSQKDIAPLLHAREPEDARFILRVSQGAPGLALRLRDDSDALLSERQHFAKASSFWHAGTLAERLQLLSPLYERSREAEQFLFHLSLSLREERPSQIPPRARELQELIDGLETNVSRPLLVQQFALAVDRP